MSGFAKILASAARRSLAGISKGACENGNGKKLPPKTSKGLVKLHKLQKEFQKDDGKPIFLKRGLFDQILYRGTVGLALIGVALDMKFYFGYF